MLMVIELLWMSFLSSQIFRAIRVFVESFFAAGLPSFSAIEGRKTHIHIHDIVSIVFVRPGASHNVGYSRADHPLLTALAGSMTCQEGVQFFQNFFTNSMQQ